MSGLLCLTWNNHYSAFLKLLTNLHLKDLYCDATIACQGKYYPVHRLVLSTCSEYFEEIFEHAKCKHPYIILKDVNSSELEALLNYMYKGEVNVSQESLPILIKAAECLRIRGLAIPDDISENSLNERERKNSTPHKEQRSKLKSKASHFNNKPNSSEDYNDSIKDNRDDKSLSNNVSRQYEEMQSAENRNNFISKKYKQENENENSLTLDLNNIKTETIDDLVYSEVFPTVSQEEHQFCSDDTTQMDDAQNSLFHSNLMPSQEENCAEKGEMQPEVFGNEVLHDSSVILGPPHFMTKSPCNPFGSTSRGNLRQLSQFEGKCYRCSLCSHECKKRSSLRLHILYQHSKKEKPYACSFCSYRCLYKNDLAKHKRKHTGEKPYSCSVCSYRGTQKHHLDNHMRTHTGERPFVCRDCPYKSSTKSTLAYHKLVKHGIK